MEQENESTKISERLPLQNIDSKRKRKNSQNDPNSKKTKRRRTKGKLQEEEKNLEKDVEVIKIDSPSKPQEKENVKQTASHTKSKPTGSLKRKASPDDKVMKIDAMFKKMKDKKEKQKDIDVIELDVEDELDNSEDSKEVAKPTLDSTLSSVDECDDEANKTTSDDKKEDPKQISKLTPKQLAKEKERQLKKEGRDKAKLAKEAEKERLRQEKEEEKERLRQQKEEEKERLKQQKEKERLELQKAKEEKLRIKKELIEAKQKEREEKQKKKDEEKQKKEDEKLRKEEERKQAEEEEKEKANKMKAKFSNFFVAKKTKDGSEIEEKDSAPSDGPFMMFRVKENMRLAPSVRSNFTEERREVLESLLKNNKSTVNYLSEIKSENYSCGRGFRTYEPLTDKPDDCEILDDEEEEEEGLENTTCILETRPTERKRAKLLQFCENRRPAYYGTWSKKSTSITGRTPFGKEDDIFDYEYDSDDDWEEEETGESLSDSEGEDGEDGEDQYEVDNDVFVPHGYLSDDEGIEDDGDSDNESSAVKDDQGEVQKKKLKEKQEEFEQEMKQKTKQLKPKVYGCVWMGDKESHPAYEQLVKIFLSHQCIPLWGMCPVGTTKGGSNIPADPKNTSKGDDSEDSVSQRKFAKEFPEKVMPNLIKLVHNNPNNKMFLVREFKAHLEKDISNEGVKTGVIPRKKIELKIQEIAQYGKDTDSTPKRKCWVVMKDILDKYLPEGIPKDFEWSYSITPKKKSIIEQKPDEKVPDDSEKNTPKPKSVANLITRFTKVMSEEEKACLISKEPKSPATPVAKQLPKKEITLTPIPSNQSQPKSSSSITKFFRKQKIEAIPESKDDGCITLD